MADAFLAYQQAQADQAAAYESRQEADKQRAELLGRFTAAWAELEQAIIAWSQSATARNRAAVGSAVSRAADATTACGWDWKLREARQRTEREFELNPTGESPYRSYIIEERLLLELIVKAVDGTKPTALSKMLATIEPSGALARAVDNARFDVATAQRITETAPALPVVSTSRPAAKRDHYFLSRYEAGLKPAAIRDEWRALPEETRKQIGGSYFREVELHNVRSSLKAAKKDRLSLGK